VCDIAIMCHIAAMCKMLYSLFVLEAPRLVRQPKQVVVKKIKLLSTNIRGHMSAVSGFQGPIYLSVN
jgi:hypothetical protein